ncbi:site-specific DNA-methyltransferase [Actinomyces sp.]|uniref:site-specific DNA-methyltransferase n=1 Tax=Actinomyces sp. TaxID=29317 RepID=UPI002913D25C|nr:DNA methyltransferase [Actinomyces sp.]MDU5231146.1 DNA methyltransferase [Actinomyces sp.]MDU6756648.1 DNA methyltransferase [Actinomyces sp.]
MSRLSDLMRQLHVTDPQLGADLEEEIKALTKRRSFGLVFERHQPEAVELPGIKPRRGSKVHVLPPRGSTKKADQRLWQVISIAPTSTSGVAELVELYAEEPEETQVPLEDLVVVAEFKDGIYPGLIETGRVERGGDKPFHTVINAENYHALEMLTYTHRGRVDAIYIDPPYNTGAKDWKYNNDYVEGDDAYRHSKWLAMMERRLLIAKELLNPEDSVLIVTIDEKEYLRLGILLEQTFPEARIQMTSIVINPNGVARDSELARVEEYAFFVALGNYRPALLEDPLLTRNAEEEKFGMATKRSSLSQRKVRWEWLLRGGTNSARAHSPGCFYPVYIDPKKKKIVKIGSPLAENEPRASAPAIDGLVTVLPIGRDLDDDRVWRLAPDTLKNLVDSGMAKVGAYDATKNRWTLLYLPKAQRKRIEQGSINITGRDKNGVVEVEYSSEVKDLRLAKTVWNRQSHNAGEYGSRLILKLLPGRRFPFPKSLYAVEDALRIAVKDKPEAVVLDFFSGSGTTAHAVMRLNKQDGGSRQCIMVTNNEVSANEKNKLRRQGLRPGDPEWEQWGICDYITKPRITAAITGNTPEGDPIKGDYKFVDEFPMSDGFEENAAFFTLTYEAPLAVRHHRAFERIAPMLWMRAGSQGKIITSLRQKGWDISEVYGVLEDFNHSADFFNALEQSETVHTVFFITDDDAVFQMACRKLPDSVKPVRLYSSYLENFEINRGRA